MKQPIYILIYNSDGDTYVKVIDKEKFTEDLNDGDYENSDFLSEIPDRDTNYWPPDSFLLLKAEIVVPAKKEVVTRYEVD